MDLSINLGEKRVFIGVSGRNIPSFEIFTSPDWRGAKGEYYADQPSFRNGNYVERVRLRFNGGKVVHATAGKGQAFLRETIAMDAGASRIGEFSLTDVRFSKIDRFMADTLFDENYGGRYGNCHIALGSSYTNAYAGNPAALDPRARKSLGFNDSALHWDLVNTENKRVNAVLRNGKTMCIYEKGKFRI
jgi:aminopeptidase